MAGHLPRTSVVARNRNECHGMGDSSTLAEFDVWMGQIRANQYNIRWRHWFIRPALPCYPFRLLILNDSCGSQAKMEHALGLSYVKP
jgi:hypothetical protein